jgi:hypothetical protein
MLLYVHQIIWVGVYCPYMLVKECGSWGTLHSIWDTHLVEYMEYAKFMSSHVWPCTSLACVTLCI